MEENKTLRELIDCIQLAKQYFVNGNDMFSVSLGPWTIEFDRHCKNKKEAIYKLLKVTKKDFLKYVYRELLSVTDIDYAHKIATTISDDVAQDVCDCADREHWSIGDVRLGIGRVLVKALGIEE